MNTVTLQLAQLVTHPRNMRRWYEEAKVTEMAASLKAVAQQNIAEGHGNIYPLWVTPHPELQEKYFVITGNMRHHAGMRLGELECPPFQAVIVHPDRAEQLLVMSIENTVRGDPDPISEGMHYARLRDEEQLTVRQISIRTGIYEKRITDRMALLELDEPIQQLIGEGKLSHDERVRKALLSIPNAKARVKLAERMAQEGAGNKAIIAACSTLVTSLEHAARQKERENDAQPMTGYAERKAGRRVDDAATPVPWTTVREAAATMCAACEVKQKQLQDVAEPAWSLVAHAAQQTCGNCPVRTVANACRACPGVEMLKRVILDLGAIREVAPRERVAA